MCSLSEKGKRRTHNVFPFLFFNASKVQTLVDKFTSMFVNNNQMINKYHSFIVSPKHQINVFKYLAKLWPNTEILP